jgi:DNA-directed RNA polymerase subunit RPC12/RpoP
MPIVVTCGSCGARLKAADRLAGRTTACPRCNTFLLVPRPASPKLAPAPAAPRQPAPVPAEDVEDAAAALLSGAEETAQTATGQKQRSPLPEGAAQASREAERLVRLLLDCADKGKDQAVYLLAFDLLREIHRRAGNGTLNHQKAAELWQRYVYDGGDDSSLRNFLIVGGPLIPAGSTRTLQEAYDLFRKALL